MDHTSELIGDAAEHRGRTGAGVNGMVRTPATTELPLALIWERSIENIVAGFVLGTALASCDIATGRCPLYIHLSRPGGRVARRKLRSGRVGFQHKLTMEDAMKWFQTKYDGIILP